MSKFRSSWFLLWMWMWIVSLCSALSELRLWQGQTKVSEQNYHNRQRFTPVPVILCSISAPQLSLLSSSSTLTLPASQCENLCFMPTHRRTNTHTALQVGLMRVTSLWTFSSHTAYHKHHLRARMMPLESETGHVSGLLKWFTLGSY